MSAFWAIVRKELRAVARERTIVIAITIQLFIASFSSVLLVGLVSYYDPESIAVNARVALTVGVLGDTRSPLLSYLRECNIRVRAFATEAEAEAAYQRRMLDAIVVLPADDGAAMEMRLILPAAETQATVILMVLKEPLSRFENALRAARGVPLHYATLRATPSTTYEFLYATILPILMFFPAFVAGSMVVDSISEEVQQHTLDTLWAAPVSLNAILGAKIAAALLLAVVQLLLWVGLLRLNRIAIANLPWVLLFALLIAALNAVLAAFVATLFKDRERSQFAYSLLIVILVGASQLLSLPPVAVLTRLAIADAYTGPLNVVAYGLALAALWAVYHVLARRMLATSL